MISGHGNFAEKLTSLKLKQDNLSKCGSIDNCDHVLLYCKLFDDKRRDLIVELMDFKNFVTKVLKKKEEFDE